MMLFTFNIGNGLTAWLLVPPFIKLAASRSRELTGGSILLGLLRLLHFLFGLPH
jgi:hypothetical protein